MTDAALAFYATHGPMTRLPDWVKPDDVPSDLAAMRDAVQGLLIHRDWVKAYGLTDDDVRIDEQNIRSTEAVLTRAREISDDPIATSRVATERVQGICRHYALLHVAFLREHGVPARMRCGFANYFGDTGKWYDHWITERWDGERWVRDDPQVDDVQRRIAKIDFDVNDQPKGKFLSADEAWALTRAGELDPDNFGIFNMWGAAFISGNVKSDFACLNRMEMLPWDFWGESINAGPFEPIPEANLPVIDEIAALAASDDFEAIRERYEADAMLRVPPGIFTMVDGQVVPASVEVD